MKKDLGIYVHIPFCVSKCVYCDFYSIPMGGELLISDYVDALNKQIELTAPAQSDDYRVVSVYFGGGTPSVINPLWLMGILDNLRKNYEFAEDCEITVECNPGTVSPASLSLYKEGGVNRLSFGLQSVNDNELEMLGRIHTFNTFLASFELARKSGFDNINVDLISAIPGQTLKDFRRSLKSVAALKPEHMSVYSLIVEDNTPLKTMLMGKNFPKLPDEDVEREMYYSTDEILDDFGFEKYEISNYAKAGFECRHNILYWNGTDYMGYGVAAASLIGGERFSIEKNIPKYVKDPMACFTDLEKLTEKDQMAEFMFLGLRMIKGVKNYHFKRKFGRNIESVYGDVVDKYVESGHMTYEDGILKLTPKGIDVSNVIFADFLQEEEDE